MFFYLCELNQTGGKDRVLKEIEDRPLDVFEYMKEMGFKRVKNGAIFFKKGKRVLYVKALVDKPKSDEFESLYFEYIHG